jgi:SAM-dependent methyltransferase
MNEQKFYELWKAEEAIAQIKGWDFSHIASRYAVTEDLPWDYREAIVELLHPQMQILDIDTGGGEFLLGLGHPHSRTAAMENYPPNVSLCANTLLPLGIDFRPGSGNGPLPFEDNRFDLILNRHGDFNPTEIFRCLKPGGIFLTQQVGAENDRELVRLLCGDLPPAFPEQHLHLVRDAFRRAGFQILKADEAFRPICFYDVGALVWFARIIQWEYPGFSVDSHFQNLLKAQRLLEEAGAIESRIHRFFLAAKKPE